MDNHTVQSSCFFSKHMKKVFLGDKLCIMKKHDSVQISFTISCKYLCKVYFCFAMAH